jgi:hypothetical protein
MYGFLTEGRRGTVTGGSGRVNISSGMAACTRGGVPRFCAAFAHDCR